MLHVNFNTYNSYVTDSLYQWDINQELFITGLNLPTIPEIHFNNSNMDRAIVRQASLEGGSIKVRIPNSLLQEALTIKAYVGIYENETFKVIELIEIPVIARKRPSDYTITDSDEEIYSFKALENYVHKVVSNASNEIREAIESDVESAKAVANVCKQAYQDCYDAINTWNFTSEDIDGGDPSLEDEDIGDEDDVNGGTPN